MKARTAQIIFYALNILAVIAIFFCIKEHIAISNALDNKLPEITFNTGTYYFLLASVFWVMSIVQWLGLHGRMDFVNRWGSMVIASWFIFCLILANVIPYTVQSKLTSAGYQSCKDGREVSGTGRGNSYIYRKGAC